MIISSDEVKSLNVIVMPMWDCVTSLTYHFGSRLQAIANLCGLPNRAPMLCKSFSAVLLVAFLGEEARAATMQVVDEAPDEVAGAPTEHLVPKLLPLLAQDAMAFQVPSLGSRAQAAPR